MIVLVALLSFRRKMIVPNRNQIRYSPDGRMRGTLNQPRSWQSKCRGTPRKWQLPSPWPKGRGARICDDEVIPFCGSLRVSSCFFLDKIAR